MLITLSHSGKQHSYHVARSLHRLGHLDVFYTSSYVTSPSLQNYFLKKNDTFFMRRFLPGLHAPQVKASWSFEVKEVLLRKMYGKNRKVLDAIYARDVNFDHYVAGQIARRPSDVFWGFQGSCHETLKRAKAAGKMTLAELATAHVTESKRILGEEQRLHPEWADSLDNLVFPAAYEKRLVEEPHLADYAVAASQFTRQTLLADGVAPEKIITLPLGFDIDYVPYKERTSDRLSRRKLRLLYAGTVTQRKGIKYLLEAMKNLKGLDVELHIIGGIQGSGQAFKEYAGLYHYHPPVAQHVLFEKYAEFDALVLPTVFEGFGLVIVEALAAGLPVIATPHSMAPEVVADDFNGYIVPVRDISRLEAAIMQLRQLSDHDYLAMRRNARASVAGFSWDAYKDKLHQVLTDYLIHA